MASRAFLLAVGAIAVAPGAIELNRAGKWRRAWGSTAWLSASGVVALGFGILMLLAPLAGAAAHQSDVMHEPKHDKKSVGVS